ncbi:MAG: chemotaxis protein CheA [Marinagarivorans sp.]
MAIDLSQFRQVFIEESFEGLDSMEEALMALNINAIDSETINAIFRAAHSIKGGSATFGYSAIAGFTHVLETLLDQVRSGQRGLDANSVNLLLKSVDAMRDMLSLLQTEQNCYTDSALALKAEFEALLQVPPGQASNASAPTALKSPTADELKPAEPTQAGWKIEFSPKRSLFATGNCPVNILRELAQLGVVIVQPELASVPDIKNINPEECYLAWHIALASSCKQAEIAAVFGWVEDQATIHIEPVFDNASALPAAAAINRYRGWFIDFKPKANLLHSGNDPLRIFRALQELGYCEINLLDTHALPNFHSYDSQMLYLHWHIRCYGDFGYEAIASVFDWVMGDCELTITPIEPSDDAAFEPPLNAGLIQAKPLHASQLTAAPQETAPTAIAAAANNVLPFVAPAPVAPAATAATATPLSAETSKKSSAAETSSIRVGIDKIDSLINMVGELVITQSMLGQLGSELNLAAAPKLMEGLSQLAQNTRELQESVMRIRMLPISFAFSRFPRMVRDLGQSLGKKIHIELNGENTELDKTVMEKIGDPLVHLVRNAVDHGIESPEVRAAKGKPEEGHIMLNAYHQSGNVIIEITDDGKGLDREAITRKAIEKNIITAQEAANFTDEQVYDLIFQPGFSTAQTVSDVSGRGVGMDVVKRNIQALNGVVEISSQPNKGSKIRIRLPLTLAILDGQLVRVNDHIYIFPLVSIVESVQHRVERMRHIAGGCSVFKLREDYVPVLHLKDVFNLESSREREEPQLMVVVESEGEKVGIVVDELLAQQQVVIKSLEQNYKKVEGVSGATILGDGTVALILDIQGIVHLAGLRQLHQHSA